MGKLYLVSLTKLKLLPDHIIIRLLITRKNLNIDGVVWCPKLAPSKPLFYEYLTKWKGNQVNNWWNLYTERFKKEMEVNPMLDALRDLYRLLSYSDVALICFCNNRQCHRYLIGEHLSKHNIETVEVV